MGNDKISNIGKRIQAFRRDRDLTQDELAARLCITAQAISKWERGVGLPDVTIIPNLADALGVTVGALFGEEEQQSNNNEGSESFDPDPINKIIKEADDDEYDELDEIDEVDEIEDTAPSGKSAFEKELSGFDSIDLSVAFPCRTNVIVSKDGFEGVKAIGSRRFISHLSVDMADNTLCVKASSLKNWTFKENQNKNSLTLYISPSCKKSVRASMAGNSSINVYADFDKASLSVSGSGNIKAQNCKTLKSIIAGSGCIELSNVSASSEISISGSGDLDAKSLGNNSSIKIAGSGSVSADAGSNVTSVITGSGDITVKSVSGDLSCNITGSGDFTCGGSVDSLSVRITGSGDFQGERLTANEAYVDITGSGDATVHRIIKNSIERLSKSASLTVMHRGEEA